MSRVETQQHQKLPLGAKIITEIVVGQLTNPVNVLDNPQKLLPSGIRQPEDIPSVELIKPLQPQRIVHTQLKGTRPPEYQDARLFQRDVYHGPIRDNDEFGRKPDNRTQRLAEAKRVQYDLQEKGVPRSKARRLSRQAVGLQVPLEDRLRAERKTQRVELFTNARPENITAADTPRVQIQEPDEKPKKSKDVSPFELTSAYEEILTGEVLPEVEKYLNTLKSPQEKAMAVAFMAQIFTIGAAKLTPDAQAELIKTSHRRQAEAAKTHGHDGVRLPPGRIAGLLLAAGLLVTLATGCAPDDETQSIPATQETAAVSQGQDSQPAQSAPDVLTAQATPAAPDTFIAEATSIPESEPSPTPQMIEIVSLDDTPATPEQQKELNEGFAKLKSEENPVISGANLYRGKELKNVLWIEDADPNNPTLNDYGRAVNDENGNEIIPASDDVVKIFMDKDLENGYFIGRTSEINYSLMQHNLPPSAVDFNISADSRLQGINEKGEIVATRNKFQKADGLHVAVYPPEGADVSIDGYSYNGIFYRFDKNSGQFNEEVLATATPEPSTPTPTPSETPTPVGPETYGMVFPTATTEDIATALNTLTFPNKWPLTYYSQTNGYDLMCVVTNIQFVDKSKYKFEGGINVVLLGTCNYLDREGKIQSFNFPLVMEKPSENLLRVTQLAGPLTLGIPGLINEFYGHAQHNPTTVMRLKINTYQAGDAQDPFMPPEYQTAHTFLEPVFTEIGFDAEQFNPFIETGNPKSLPTVNGAPFLPPLLIDSD